MFTGLVQALASVQQIVAAGPGKRLMIAAPGLAAAATIGDSIAVNGCCLTVVEIAGPALCFEAGPETLSRTNLDELVASSQVNLEPSLRAGDQLGGHYVSGHVEAVGTVDARQDDAEWSTFWFRFPSELGRYIVSKGSIAVDGVSLTVVDVEPQRFSVQLIPHTLSVTTLGKLRPGNRVNLETDLLAKYVEKLLAGVPR